jgi:hypothetical protein
MRVLLASLFIDVHGLAISEKLPILDAHLHYSRRRGPAAPVPGGAGPERLHAHREKILKPLRLIAAEREDLVTFSRRCARAA